MQVVKDDAEEDAGDLVVAASHPGIICTLYFLPRYCPLTHSNVLE